MPRLVLVHGGHHVVLGQHVGHQHVGFVQHVGPQHVGLGQHVGLVQVGGYGHQVVLPHRGIPLPVQAIHRVPKPTVHVTQSAPQGDHCDISYKGPGKVAGQPGLRMIEVWGSVVKDCGPYPG